MREDHGDARRAVIDHIDCEIFPGVDPQSPPQNLRDWERLYCYGDDGVLRLRQLLRTLSKKGYEPAQRKQLHDYFAATEPPITEDQIDKLLYQQRPPRLCVDRRKLIIGYLWEAGMLPGGQPRAAQVPADAVKELHASLVWFLDISGPSLLELQGRLAGRYWIYRPSAREPGQYVKGLLTVRGGNEPTNALTVTEHYRITGDGTDAECGFQELYDGLILETSHRPFLLLRRRLPALAGRRGGERQELTAFCMTVIAAAEADSDGRLASMTGFTAASEVARGFLACAVCFDRIPPTFRRDPAEELRTLPELDLPRSVLNRLRSFVNAHGLIRL